MNKLFLFSFIFFFIISCKKDPVTITEYIETTKAWMPVAEIDQYSKYIRNAKSFGDKAIFQSEISTIIKSPTGIESLYNPSSMVFQTDLSENFALGFVEQFDNIDLLPITKSGPPAYIPNYILDTAPAYVKMGGLYFSNQWSAIRTDEKQYIFHYFTDSATPSGEATTGFCLADFGEKYPNNSTIYILDLKYVVLPRTYIYSNLAVKSYFNKYFICFEESMLIMEGDGTYTFPTGIPQTMSFHKLIKKNNTVYVFGEQVIYSSSDMRNSWQLVMDNIPSSFLRTTDYHYHNVDNEIIITRGNNLSHLQITTDSLIVKPLVYEGLENNKITSVIKYKEDVYVTTTSGTFKRPFAEFYHYID